MNICILSMQRVENLGSIMQSYSLKKMIESLGHTVCFIDIEKENLSGENSIKKRIKFISKKFKLNSFFFKKIKQHFLSKQQYALFEIFRRNKLRLSQNDNKKHYDCCVIGSDEVFNCMQKSPWGKTAQLFGDVKQADRVITYAASCGMTEYEMLDVKTKKIIKDAMRNIKALSVRDGNTEKFVKMFSILPVFRHMDPVMIADFDRELANVDWPLDFRGKYCVIYAYRNRFNDVEEIEEIKEFCRQKKFKIVTVSASYQLWCKNDLILEPFQILKVFQQAEFVITDTFHGTIFASKYAKKYAVYVRKSNKNKLLDLIDELDIFDHLHSKHNKLAQIYKIYNINNDIQNIRSLERKNYELAIKYLKENLATKGMN